ncbi:hypothetical protein AKO1_009358 [Acrasis kona]|uniref:EF-hand domain-containing protein n=1 Tax=Acrasis kona TaxID=1008807 RepID=A0AAW2ZKX4_9EUKA
MHNFPDATEISLESCGLTTLDEVLPDLVKFRNLKVLRLGNNNLSSLPGDMSGLQKLEYLDLTNNPFVDLERIMSGLFSLPSLKYLYINLDEKDEDDIIVSLTNLESFNGTHAKNLHHLSRDYLSLHPDFSQFSSTVVRELHEKVDRENDPLKFQTELLNSKHAIDAVSKKDKKLSSLMLLMKQCYSGLLEDCFDVMFSVNADYHKKMIQMQKDLDHAAAETLEKESAENENAKKWLAERLEGEKERLVEEVGWLRAELEKQKNRLRQFQLNRQKISTQVNTSPKQLLQQSMKEKFNDPSTKSKLPLQPIKSNKTLSLRQTKEIIDEIYASKAKFDQKCVDNKLPRETMEQHLYTFLNQKYGLKNLILDWASAIIQAVKKFTSEDNDVAVFGKILRNEIDEEFRFVQKQLRETVAELLRVYLKGKYSRKVDGEIQQMLAQRMSGSLNEDEWVDIIKYMYNKEDSVNVIIKVNEGIRQLRAKKSRRPNTGNSSSNSSSRTPDDDVDDDDKGANKIPYVEFLRVLLNFQLRGHERFLTKFVRLFRQFDADKNGILNELEFRHLLLHINPHRTEENIEHWLNYTDPYNNQQITFSECVTFLSADLVKMMHDKKGLEDDDASEQDHHHHHHGTPNMKQQQLYVDHREEVVEDILDQE